VRFVPAQAPRRPARRPTPLDLALSRAVVLGLPPDARRVLHWGAGTPATIAGLASLFGDAVAVDPAHGIDALDEHARDFDLAVADLTGRARVRGRALEPLARALVRAVRPQGMALLRLPAPGVLRRRSAETRTLRAALAAEGAEVLWAERDSDGAVWLYVVAARHLAAVTA
jgi:hypothetical protein